MPRFKIEVPVELKIVLFWLNVRKMPLLELEIPAELEMRLELAKRYIPELDVEFPVELNSVLLEPLSK